MRIQSLFENLNSLSSPIKNPEQCFMRISVNIVTLICVAANRRRNPERLHKRTHIIFYLDNPSRTKTTNNDKLATHFLLILLSIKDARVQSSSIPKCEENATAAIYRRNIVIKITTEIYNVSTGVI